MEESLSKLFASDEYKSWRKSHEGSFLSHVFGIIEKGKETEWQVGFYDPIQDKIATFILQGGNITVNPNEEVFKQENKLIELDFMKVRIKLEDALSIAEEFKNKNYPAEVADKTIVILQNLKMGIVWNMTMITKSFNTINFKINAVDGFLIEHKKSPIFDFRAK